VGLINRHDAAQGDLVEEHSEGALRGEGALGVQPLNLLASVLVEAEHVVDRRGAHVPVVALGVIQAQGNQKVYVVTKERYGLCLYESENGAR